MTEPANERDAGRQRRIAWTVIAAGLALLLAGLVVSPVGATTAQNQSYWNDTQYNESLVQNESWTTGAEEPTAENTTGYISRVGTFIVGSQRGSAVGALITSLIAGGIVVGMLGGTRPGAVAGGVVGITTLGGMTAAGMAPQWLWAIVIIGLGLLTTQVFIRALR